MSETKQRGIVITDRDLAMFESLSTARYLTAQAIEWLHYSGWQERQARHEQRQAGYKYKPSRLLYNRLSRLCAADLIRKTVRTATMGTQVFRREPDLYTLTEAGALALADGRGLDFETLWFERRRDRSVNTLAHAGDIGTVYAALRAKLMTRPDLTLVSWAGDHLLARKGNHDTVQLGVGNWAGIIPDAAFRIQAASGAEMLYFLELDRGRHVSTWREKIRAYALYQGSRPLVDRYGVERFSLLTVTTTPQQRKRLMDATTQELEKKPAGYYFTELSLVNPATIGQCFVVESIVPAQKALGQKLLTVYTVDQEKPHVWLA